MFDEVCALLIVDIMIKLTSLESSKSVCVDGCSAFQNCLERMSASLQTSLERGQKLEEEGNQYCCAAVRLIKLYVSDMEVVIDEKLELGQSNCTKLS